MLSFTANNANNDLVFANTKQDIAFCVFTMNLSITLIN